MTERGLKAVAGVGPKEVEPWFHIADATIRDAFRNLLTQRHLDIEVPTTRPIPRQSSRARFQLGSRRAGLGDWICPFTLWFLLRQRGFLPSSMPEQLLLLLLLLFSVCMLSSISVDVSTCRAQGLTDCATCPRFSCP